MVRAVASSSPSVKTIPRESRGTVHSIRPHASLAAGVCVYALFYRPGEDTPTVVRFDLTADALGRRGAAPEPGDEVLWRELEELQKSCEEIYALRDARAMAARREHSAGELQRKLQRKGYSPGVIAHVLAVLKRDGWQDDMRFAREWVQSRMARRGTSRTALLAGLQRAGVREEIAREAIREHLQDHPRCFEEALAAAARSMGDVPREKLIRRLLSRGFDFVEVKKFLA